MKIKASRLRESFFFISRIPETKQYVEKNFSQMGRKNYERVKFYFS